jgi:hypothetical protein
LVRALVALLIGATPSFEDRFGSAALPLVCAGLAGFTALAAYLTFRSEAARTWPVNAADSLTLAVLTPVVVLASDIAVADPRLGGGTSNFGSAALAAVAISAIVALLVAALAARGTAPDAIAVLPASLTITIALVGAERFAGASVTDALSAAWMLAAVATIIDGIAAVQVRSIVPAAAFAIAATAAVALSRSHQQAEMNSGNARIAFLATVAAGIVLLSVPPLARAIGRSDASARPEARNGAPGR